jgi:hypothetical protein
MYRRLRKGAQPSAHLNPKFGEKLHRHSGPSDVRFARAEAQLKLNAHGFIAAAILSFFFSLTTAVVVLISLN